jgi:hypothetical protein
LSSDKDKIIQTDSQIIEAVGYISASENKYVTVKLDHWYYYMGRAKMSIYEGAYRLEELKSVEEKCVRADTGSEDAHDCPRHFTIICRPSDLVELARSILKLYSGY